MAGVPQVPATARRPQYGDQARMDRMQQAIPVDAAPTDAAPPPALLRPSERPGEPVTAGIPMGAGPGPEALAPAGIEAGSRLDLILTVRAAAARYPNPNLLALLRDLERKR